MRVGFLITYFYPVSGGAENNCYYLAKELAKKNEVHVFCSGRTDSDEIIDGINVHRSKEWLRIKYYLAFYPGIVRNLLKYNLDILHVHGLGFIQHDWAIKKLKKAHPKLKVVCTPHGPFMALNKYGIISSALKSVYMPLLRASLNKYDRFIEVNPDQKSWMIGEYGISEDKIRFVPNGLDLMAIKKVPEGLKKKVSSKYGLSGKFVISYLGRIQKYKGLDQVINALPEIIRVRKDAIFVAIGKDAGDKERLQSIAKALNVESRVIFTGEVSETEKFALLDISELFVFPSEWEAFGIAMLESMARGNAVISTKTEGGRYLIKKESGFLYEFGDIKGLLKSATKIITDYKKRKAMQSFNQSMAKKYLWGNIATQLREVYSD